MLSNIAVFCGSNVGNDSCYREAAENLVDTLYAHQMALVYGGAKVGLMGVIADRMLKNGGKVVGVIPQSLTDVELVHANLTELHIVNSMHERKLLTEKISDAFILLPGGPGSLDEFFEMMTWAQLGLHTKPCGILNINGYYDSLLNMLDQMVIKGFLKEQHRHMIFVSVSVEELINSFMTYKPKYIKKWISESK